MAHDKMSASPFPDNDEAVSLPEIAITLPGCTITVYCRIGAGCVEIRIYGSFVQYLIDKDLDGT